MKQDPGFDHDQDEHAEMLEVLTIGDESFEQHRDVLQQDKGMTRTWYTIMMTHSRS